MSKVFIKNQIDRCQKEKFHGIIFLFHVGEANYTVYL